MVAFMGLPLLVLNCFAVINPESDRTLLFGSISISPAAMTLLIWIAIPLIFATSLGQGWGKVDIWGKDAIPSFFAVRPLTTPQFIAVKLVAVAISTCVCWAIILMFVTVWALVEASPLNSHASLVRSHLAELTPRTAATGGLVLAGLVAATWRTIVIGMWPSLAGRKWLSMTVGISMFGQLTIAVLACGWIYRHPEVQDDLSTALPWSLGCLLALKLCGAAGALAALKRLRLITPHTTALLLGCWLAAIACILTALSVATPLNWQLVAIVVLGVPLVRIFVAPIALFFNRHR